MTEQVNFDQLIRRSRFNLESARNAIQFLESDPVDVETLETYIQKLESEIHKLEIAREVGQKEVLTQEDVNKVMQITCFANLGYCCGLDKACIWRDACQQALGITRETYVEIKEAAIWRMLDYVGSRSVVTPP